MFNFVNKTSTIFYLLVGLIIGIIAVYAYRQYKTKKNIQSAVLAAMNSQTNNSKTNTDTDVDNSDADTEE